MNAPARLDVAWNAASGALDASRTWASAVVRLECEWDPATGDASCRATLDRAGDVRTVPVPAAARMEVRMHGLWVHLELSAGAEVLLRASFERGRLAYCTSTVPGLAGLRGGTYDPPTGILELYQRAAA
jgi:hypothetical protein